MGTMIFLNKIKKVLETKETYQFILREAARHPRSLGQLVENRNPKLAKTFISYASELMEPQLLGLGIRVKKSTDELILAQLPYTWRNKDSQGFIKVTSVLALVEFVVKLFWEKHLDSSQLKIRVVGVEIDFDKLPIGDIFCQMTMPIHDRELVEYSLLSQGQHQLIHTVLLFGDNHTQCSNLDLRICLEYSKALPG